MRHEQRWTREKIAQRIELLGNCIYRRHMALPEWRYLSLQSPADPAPAGIRVDDTNWETIPVLGMWGAIRQEFALRTRFTVPQDWSGHEVALYLPIGIANDFSHPETLAYIDGEPISSVDRHHQEVRVPPCYFDGQPHVVTLRGWCGGVRVDPAFKLIMRACELVQVDLAARELFALARVAHGIAVELDENDPARYQLLTSLDLAFLQLDTLEPIGDGFYASVPNALTALRDGIAKSGTPLPVQITAAGHAHIDVAWLWTLGQTRRKSARTFFNVLRLSEQFPDFTFSQSQPQLYDYIRQDFPELFEEIRAAVKRGAWEPLGGMWVEADCNLSGGESLARQFLLGRAFFRKYFGEGAESPVLWLPDVFGYAWNLPQLIKEAGLEYFFTIKIGWNQYNRLPYDSFYWQGLDGTRVLTHFSTTPEHAGNFRATYNGKATPDQILTTWSNATQKESQRPGVYPPLLISYGHGDGGGGPTREMLENITLMKHFPATPQVQFGKVGDFFRKLEREMGEELPTWNGELYLELHRGTYTTQAQNKRANRKSEFALHDAEFLATLAASLDETYPYPTEELHQAWELVCLNQFHDIIPGSSIHQVYVESQQQYNHLLQLVRAIRDDALCVIRDLLGGEVLAINPTSFARCETALWVGGQPGVGLSRADGVPLVTQVVENGVLVGVGELPAYSVLPLSICEAPAALTASREIKVDVNLLENEFVRVELNDSGDIMRIFDKTNRREVLPAGALANQLQAFEDRPRKWDAWDVEIYYDDRQWLAEPAESVRVVECGPLRSTIEIRRRVLHSSVVQRISLGATSARLDFDTLVDWQERHVFLKAAFPVDVLAHQATYEIQWGNVQRPTHRNTSWDWARFETCAQKWVDLSEGGYGVALLNDSKYGHDIHDNVIRLSLLRASTNPDPEADQGEQRFCYSLLPHAGSWDEQVIAQAYFLNDPLIVVGPELGLPAGEIAAGAHLEDAAFLNELQALGAPTVGPLVLAGAEKLETKELSYLAVDAPQVIIETIKIAEDGLGVIVRLYESQRKRGLVNLKCAQPLAAAWRTNLLEENHQSLDVHGDTVSFQIRPYQIVTLRLLLKK